MPFSKQRLLIILLFLALPGAFVLALLQRDSVADFVLRFSLRLVQVRSGQQVYAKSWFVDPLRFTASLQDVSWKTDGARLEAERVSIQISPISLLVGALHFRRLEVRNSKLTLEAVGTAQEPSSEFEVLDLPNKVGFLLKDVTQKMERRHISFEELVVNNLALMSPSFVAESLDLALRNYRGGQARAEWTIRNFQVPSVKDGFSESSGSVALIRRREKEYALLISGFKLSLAQDDAGNKVEASGQIPGDLKISVDVDLGLLHQKINKVNGYPFVALNGQLQANGGLDLRSKEVRLSKFKVNAKSLRIDEYIVGALQAQVDGDAHAFKISQLQIKVPKAPGDRDGDAQVIRSELIEIKDRMVSGRVEMDGLGLCGVLRATAVDECFVPVSFSGGIEVSGLVSPFDVKLRPQLRFTNARVMSVSTFEELNDNNLLATIKDGVIEGEAQVFASHMFLSPVRLKTSEQSAIEARGRIDFNPTKVDLEVNTNESSRWEDLFPEFLDIPVSGQALVSSRVLFDSRATPRRSRTTVRSQLSVRNLELSGQELGELSGPVVYSGGILRFGRLSLVNGGGRGTIIGDLTPRDGQPAWLRVQAALNRVEVRANGVESGSEIFRGFLSGKADLEGAASASAEDFLSGPLRLQISNFRVFDVPFDRGVINAQYTKRHLELRDVSAERGSAKLTVTGMLRADKGTRIEFNSAPMPIEGINIIPELRMFQEGLVSVSGFWEGSGSWAAQCQLNKLVTAGRTLDNGSVDLSGTNNSFQVKLALGDKMQFEMRQKTLSGQTQVERVQFRAVDEGLFAAFSYLKQPTAVSRVRTNGRIEFLQEGSSGFLETEDLEFIGPVGREQRMASLLSLPSRRRLTWSQGLIRENGFRDSEAMSVSGELGSTGASMDLKLNFAFLDLLVPKFRFIDGQLAARLNLPLPMTLNGIIGSGELVDGVLEVPGLGQSLDGLTGKFELTKMRLNFPSFKASLGSGEVTGTGLYRIDAENPAIRLSMRLSGAQAVLLDDIPLEATGDLSLSGDRPPYRLRGRLGISNAVYGKEFQASTNVVDGGDQPFFDMAVDVDLGSQVVVRNSLANTVVGGRLTFEGTELNPLISGQVDIVSGQIIANENVFQVIQGNVSFPGDQASPIINLQAFTNLKYSGEDYRVELRTKGSVDVLNIEFSSEPGLANQDILDLLAFGVIRGSDSELGSTGDLVSAAQVEAFQALFGKALGRSIKGSTGFDVSFRSAPDSSQREFIPKVTVVRKLSDKMTATFGRSLDFAKPENNFQVDYQLFKNVNVSGVWDEGINASETGGSTSSTSSSLGVDLRFKFEIR